MRDQICSMTTIFFQNQWSVQNWYDAPYLANNIIKGTFALTRNLNLKKVCINKKKQKTVFNPKKNVTWLSKCEGFIHAFLSRWFVAFFSAASLLDIGLSFSILTVWESLDACVCPSSKKKEKINIKKSCEKKRKNDIDTKKKTFHRFVHSPIRLITANDEWGGLIFWQKHEHYCQLSQQNLTQHLLRF